METDTLRKKTRHSDLNVDQCILINMDSGSDTFSEDIHLSPENSNSLLKDSAEISEPVLPPVLDLPVFFTTEIRNASTAVNEGVANNIVKVAGYSEDDLINIIFEACNLKETGLVPASVFIKYLEDVTGQSHEKCRLLILYNMLDPKRQNIFIDRETFHATMKSWIATCYHDCILDDEADENRSSKRNMRKNRGSTSFLSDEDYETFQETAEDMIFDSLTSNVEDLKYRNRKLNVQIQGMQKAMKVLDETCLQLTDEIAELKSRLTSMHQPLENLKYVSNELDDIRSKTMNLCEENHVVRGCCRRPNSKAQEEKKSAVYEVLSVEDAWEYLQDFLQEIKSQKNSMFLALTDEIALKEQLSHSLLSVIRMLACLRPFIENWNKVIKRLKTTFLECLELSTKSTSIQEPELQKVLLEESDETKKQSEQNTAEAESHHHH